MRKWHPAPREVEPGAPSLAVPRLHPRSSLSASRPGERRAVGGERNAQALIYMQPYYWLGLRVEGRGELQSEVQGLVKRTMMQERHN